MRPCFVSTQNLGYGRAVNRAARDAQGEVLVLLNDDSVVDPGYVERDRRGARSSQRAW